MEVSLIRAAKAFSCRPEDLYDTPLFWIGWNNIVDIAEAQASRRKSEAEQRRPGRT